MKYECWEPLTGDRSQDSVVPVEQGTYRVGLRPDYSSLRRGRGTDDREIKTQKNYYVEKLILSIMYEQIFLNVSL